MGSSETFEIPLAAAEAYEATFVPALFAEWATLLVDAAGVRAGHAVLDAACGTGVVARIAADRLDGSGAVVGLDLNKAMLTVARRGRPGMDWRQGDVAAMPFPDRTFDVVLCQMALMFFPDRVAALREMGRVVTGSGVVGIVVPATLADQPAYRLLVEATARHAGPDAQAAVGAYWSCGDLDELTGWFARAGLDVLAVRTHRGTARFSSPDELVATEINASPLAGLLDPAAYERLRADAAAQLSSFVTAGGDFEPPLYGHIVTARPRSRRPSC